MWPLLEDEGSVYFLGKPADFNTGLLTLAPITVVWFCMVAQKMQKRWATSFLSLLNKQVPFLDLMQVITYLVPACKVGLSNWLCACVYLSAKM